MRAIAVHREGEHVIVEIEANAFLHHMVRNIVGSLLPVGRGEQPREWIAQLLHGRDRARPAPTAPAHGIDIPRPALSGAMGAARRSQRVTAAQGQ